MKEIATASEGRQARRYVYDPHRYLFDVKVPAAMAAVVLPVALIFAFVGFVTPIAIGVAVLCAYVLFNTFIAKTYPRVVELDEDALSLTSFGRTDTYRIDELERLQVRENGMTHNAYIRVNGGGLMCGRYFVGCGDLYDSEGNKALDLYQFFLDTEARLDPENIRVRSRAASARNEASAAQRADAKPGKPGKS